MHASTFNYLKPTDDQLAAMALCRKAAKDYADVLLEQLPDCADRKYLLRKLREVAMWTNIAITRHSDGSPRP